MQQPLAPPSQILEDENFSAVVRIYLKHLHFGVFVDREYLDRELLRDLGRFCITQKNLRHIYLHVLPVVIEEEQSIFGGDYPLSVRHLNGDHYK